MPRVDETKTTSQPTYPDRMPATVLRLRPHDGTRAVGVVWLIVGLTLAFFLLMLGLWNEIDAVLAIAALAGVVVPILLAIRTLRLRVDADGDGLTWCRGFRTRTVGWEQIRAVHEPALGMRQEISLDLTDGRTLRLPSLTPFAVPRESEPGGEVGTIALAHFRWQLAHSPDAEEPDTG